MLFAFSWEKVKYGKGTPDRRAPKYQATLSAFFSPLPLASILSITLLTVLLTVTFEIVSSLGSTSSPSRKSRTLIAILYHPSTFLDYWYFFARLFLTKGKISQRIEIAVNINMEEFKNEGGAKENIFLATGSVAFP